MSEPRASVVVVAHGQLGHSRRCLETLRATLGGRLGTEFELVLVDNGSPDDTRELFRTWQPSATVVELNRNQNFAGGSNAGARVATGRTVVFLNNDIEVRPGALDAVVVEAEREGVGAVGARLVYPDGTLQHGGFGWRRSRDGTLRQFHFFQRQPGDLPHASTRCELQAVTGACLAVPRELFRAAGGFDERYVNGWEDIDLCLRLRERGCRIVYCGEAFLVHHEGATGGRVYAGDENESLFRSRWDASLSDDSTRIDAVFGARFDPAVDEAHRVNWGAEPGELSFEGGVLELGPDGDESRALLGLCERAGIAAASRDWSWPPIVPRFGARETAVLAAAQARAIDERAPTVHVQHGTMAPVPEEATIVRLARVPSRLPRDAVVWAASAALARRLVSAGHARESVAVLPPPLTGGPTPAGGLRDGVLAVLPAHEPAASSAVLDALTGLEAPVRLLPTVATPSLLATARERSPEAELRRPCSAEGAFAAEAASARVVLCCDPRDAYDRRALAAAAAGAFPVAAGAGPAAEADVALAVRDPGDPAEVRTALKRALQSERSPAEIQAAASAVFGADVLAERIRHLLERVAHIR